MSSHGRRHGDVKRIRLFEWEDQPWLPAALRDCVTDHLRFTFGAPGAGNLRETIARIVGPPLGRSMADRIVDVCSGGGGPLPAVLPLLERDLGRPIGATLTDRFPNRRAFERAEEESGGRIRGELASISAWDVPPSLGPFETLFTAFHHFDPDDAQAILADAARKRRTIVVVEPFRRREALLVGLGGFLRGVILTPRVGRMTLARALWTYPVPISAAVLGWDGFVSCLRAYSADEMLSLARGAASDGYVWSAGVEPIPGSPLGLAVTWLVGEPADRAPRAPQPPNVG